MTMTDQLIAAATVPCRFCDLAGAPEATRFGSVYAVLDGYAVTEGHALIIPVAHRAHYFELTEQEIVDTTLALRALYVEHVLSGVTDFNIGWNVGEAAGQTIGHAHCHLIPRRPDDVDDPTGGVRGVIPARQTYDRDAGPTRPPIRQQRLMARAALRSNRASDGGTTTLAEPYAP